MYVPNLAQSLFACFQRGIPKACAAALFVLMTPGTYFVRVRAINALGPGLPSNEVIVQK